MLTVAIIPARMASSRFPGKPLKPILGQPMIEHVRRKVLLCDLLDEVYVATCDYEIAEEVRRFGGKVIMTSSRHESCVDRIAEAAEQLSADIIINVQGDMPLVRPEMLESLALPLIKEDRVNYTDMMGPILDEQEIYNPNVVKVVCDLSGHALYYSREPVPSSKKFRMGKPPYNKQLGINAFRKESLKIFRSLPRTPLEKIESVDMLRLLENGYKVRMVSSPYPVVGVDTPEDLKKVEALMQMDDR